MKKYEKLTVGQIVADSFANADVFAKYGIDFCCNGSDTLTQACAKSKASVDDVLAALDSVEADGATSAVEFKTWPLDLLCDYILKFHHRNIRRDGPPLKALLDKVCSVHGEKHEELIAVRQIFTASLTDLYSHLDKEEQVLFPHIYAMFDAQQRGVAAPEFHCGTISAPISVMMAEHDAEGERYHRIESLTHGYKTPDDGCDSYRLLMGKLKAFNEGLHQHIHLENNIVFPAVIELERQQCDKHR